MSTFTIRSFKREDLDAVAAVHNAVFPEFPETAEEIAGHDAQNPPGLIWERLVAEDAGRIVGVAKYTQSNLWAHLNKYSVDVIVHPDWQGQGIGKALYGHMTAALEQHKATQLKTVVRENQVRGCRFAADRDFIEQLREQESRLTVSGFEPSTWVEAVRRVEADGITIRAYAELQDMRDLRERIENLFWQIGQDIPQSEPPTRPPFEEWVKRFDRPGFLPDGNFVAFDGGIPVGTSVLWSRAANANLFTGTTGVIRSHRKRGIATALKVRALTYAKQRGAPFVYTSNEVNNTGMLGINARLGFERLPSWMVLAKEVKNER